MAQPPTKPEEVNAPTSPQSPAGPQVPQETSVSPGTNAAFLSDFYSVLDSGLAQRMAQPTVSDSVGLGQISQPAKAPYGGQLLTSETSSVLNVQGEESGISAEHWDVSAAGCFWQVEIESSYTVPSIRREFSSKDRDAFKNYGTMEGRRFYELILRGTQIQSRSALEYWSFTADIGMPNYQWPGKPENANIFKRLDQNAKSLTSVRIKHFAGTNCREIDYKGSLIPLGRLEANRSGKSNVSVGSKFHATARFDKIEYQLPIDPKYLAFTSGDATKDADFFSVSWNFLGLSLPFKWIEDDGSAFQYPLDTLKPWGAGNLAQYDLSNKATFAATNDDLAFFDSGWNRWAKSDTSNVTGFKLNVQGRGRDKDGKNSGCWIALGLKGFEATAITRNTDGVILLHKYSAMPLWGPIPEWEKKPWPGGDAVRWQESKGRDITGSLPGLIL